METFFNFILQFSFVYVRCQAGNLCKTTVYNLIDGMVLSSSFTTKLDIS